MSDGQAATAPSAPTVVGFVFDHWDQSFSSVTQDMTIQAIYRSATALTVTFKAYSGSESYEYVEPGAMVTVPASTLDTNQGYYFDGWNTKQDGTGTTYWPGAKITVTAPFTLYERGGRGFAITFDPNATYYYGSGTPVTLYTDRAGYLTIPGMGESGINFTNTQSRTFSTWSPVANPSGQETGVYLVGERAKFTANKTLYAIWIANATTKWLEHVDVRFVGSLTIYQTVNGVIDPSTEQTVNLTVSNPKIKVGSAAYRDPNSSQSFEARLAGLKFTMADSVWIKATIGYTLNGTPYSVQYEHELSSIEKLAAAAECPNRNVTWNGTTSLSNYPGLDVILRTKDISDVLQYHTVTFKDYNGGVILQRGNILKGSTATMPGPRLSL